MSLVKFYQKKMGGILVKNQPAVVRQCYLPVVKESESFN